MSFEQLIKQEVEKAMMERQGLSEELHRKISEMHACIEFLASIIVAQQKDACEAMDITPETLRRKILEGHVTPFSKDGSRLNFVSIKQITDLRPKIRSKRKSSSIKLLKGYRKVA